MTTALDRKLLPKVAGIVEKYGVTATFKLTGPLQHDPETGEVNPEQPDTKTVKVTPPARYSVDLLSGSIQPNDAYVYVAADGLSFEPECGMVVEVSGRSWGIESVTKIVSGDNVAAFKLQLRT